MGHQCSGNLPAVCHCPWVRSRDWERVRPLCKKAYIMPQGPICHEPVEHHALCVTIPIWHKVWYGTRPLCTMPFVSQFRYGTRSDMAHDRCAPWPSCHNSDMSQGPICHKPVLHHALCVTIPIWHRVRYVKARCAPRPSCHNSDMAQGPICQSPLCTTSFVSQCRYITAESFLCAGLFMSQWRSVCPICHKVRYVIIVVRVRVRIPLETYRTLYIKGVWHNGSCDTAGSILWHTEHGVVAAWHVSVKSKTTLQLTR